jgi:hypothetical protein
LSFDCVSTFKQRWAKTCTKTKNRTTEIVFFLVFCWVMVRCRYLYQDVPHEVFKFEAQEPAELHSCQAVSPLNCWPIGPQESFIW